MKQENKEILLKDICARLPYRVKCSFGVDDAIYEITGINPSACGASEIQATHVKSGVNGDFKLNSCKPYLFPLSSITEEQEQELITITNGKFRYRWGVITNAIPRKNTSEWGVSENAFIDGIEVINILYIWLLKNHFDINGLISMGLAIDATNLNIY